jgi:adenine-specific DNA-methyltransferase
MNKLNMQTTNIVDENIKRIGEFFPNCLTERLNAEGKPEVAIDFDQLRQELSKDIVEGNEERYQFTWPDKRNAIRLANAPTTDTLRPCRSESVDFDNTQNLYIEGDNLQVLKLLRENYLGKVKMIYIDPPYNTGNDFVYNDDFAQSVDEYVHNSGQTDEEGNRLVANTESNGRFHTDWLNMIYPRLKVAKDLLSEDGVIFISIDDNEQRNLKNICDEVFGSDNFVAQVIWKNKFGSGALTAGFIGVHEYIYVYSRKRIQNITRSLTEQERDTYNKTRDSKFATRGGYVTQPLAVTTFGDRPNLRYPIIYKDQEIWPKKQWVWEKNRMLAAIKNDEVVFNLQKDGSYNLRSKKYLIDENGRERRGKPTTLISDVYTQNGTEEIRNLFNQLVFDYTKPVDLVKYFVGLEINNKVSDNDIILDFFSGSATTAHAVMQLNAEDGGKRKFIMVQLPEATDEKSEAYKAGYKNICEIGKERIRRAGKKIKQESPLTTQDLDTGFRVLKLDSSNMQDVYYTPAEFNEQKLFDDNIKPDRLGNDGEDLLFQTMIELGIELSAKIEKRSIAGKAVWSVSDGYLMACFDEEVNETAITEIARQQPYYFVMRDSSLANDQVADNFEQIWEEYSKDTVRRIL